METRSDEVWGRSSVSSSHLSEDTNLHGGESFFLFLILLSWSLHFGFGFGYGIGFDMCPSMIPGYACMTVGRSRIESNRQLHCAGDCIRS